MIRRAAIPLVVLAVLAAAGTAHADEFHLKDGTKIVGTIVGYENDSFRVETSYGFALVRKDKIAEIVPSSGKKDSDSATKPATPVRPENATAPPQPANNPAASAPSSLPAPKRELASAIAPPKAGAPPVVLALKPPAIPATAALPIARILATDAVQTPPPAPPEPTVIRDEVSGNLYLNHTYGFRMYKPPSWDLAPEARSALPNAIAALGTADQTTLLVVGLEPTKDSLDKYTDAMEKALADIYENYRAISSRRTVVAGAPAVERRARGLLDGHDWSVILLTFVHGNDTYTLLGMTYAGDDLIQVQENVIAKAMNSLSFVTP